MPQIARHCVSQTSVAVTGLHCFGLVGVCHVRKQKPPTAHHYVPVWLLNRFCDEQGVIWWRRHDWPLGKVRPSSPEAIFKQNHLNTRYAANGARDYQVEAALVDLDGEIAGITARLVDQCRHGHSPHLDEASRASLYRYMFIQFKRSPEMWAGSGTSHNARVDAVLQPHFEVSRVLKTKGLCLVSVPRGSALVVGSKVVLRASAGRAGRLEDSDHGLAIPLASDVLLVLIHGSSRREYDLLSEADVDSINHSIAQHCEAIAGSSCSVVGRPVT